MLISASDQIQKSWTVRVPKPSLSVSDTVPMKGYIDLITVGRNMRLDKQRLSEKNASKLQPPAPPKHVTGRRRFGDERARTIQEAGNTDRRV